MSSRKRTGNWAATDSSWALRTRLPSGSLCFQIRATRTCEAVAISDEVMTPFKETKGAAKSGPAAPPHPAINAAKMGAESRHVVPSAPGATFLWERRTGLGRKNVNLERIAHRCFAEDAQPKRRACRAGRRFPPQQPDRGDADAAGPVVAQREPYSDSGLGPERTEASQLCPGKARFLRPGPVEPLETLPGIAKLDSDGLRKHPGAHKVAKGDRRSAGDGVLHSLPSGNRQRSAHIGELELPFEIALGEGHRRAGPQGVRKAGAQAKLNSGAGLDSMRAQLDATAAQRQLLARDGLEVLLHQAPLPSQREIHGGDRGCTSRVAGHQESARGQREPNDSIPR